MRSAVGPSSARRYGFLAVGLLFSAPSYAIPTFTVNSTLDQPDDLAQPGTCHTAAGTCTLRAAIMQANRSSGGGVFNLDASPAIFNLRNSLVAGNIVSGAPVYDDCTGTLHSYGRNLFWNLPGCTVAVERGGWGYLFNLTTLGPLQSNGGPTKTVALLPGSRAIDFDDPVGGCVDYNSATLTTDQRDSPRVVGTYRDVGAFEYSPPIFSNGFETGNTSQWSTTTP